MNTAEELEQTLAAIDAETAQDDHVSPISRVAMIKGEELQIQPVSWLWDGWLARGKLEIIAGPPGTGKTTLALAMAATITSGGHWPDAAPADTGRVVIWSGEDDPSDTLAPRLLAMGADMRRVSFIDHAIDEEGVRPFDPAVDAPALCDAIRARGGADLLIIDPVVSAVAGDSHKNSETRRALQPLVDLARELGCCVLGVSHFAKGSAGRNPVDRVAGSLAFGALARVVLAAVKLPDDDPAEHSRIFCRVKSNLGPDGGGFGYDLEQVELANHPGIFTSRVLWTGAVDGAAHELLARADQMEADEERSDVEQFLLEELSAGPVPAKELRKRANDAGISWRTLKYHKKRLGVESRKRDFSSGWEWFISGQDFTEGTTKEPTQKPLPPSPPSTTTPIEEPENTPENPKGAKGANENTLDPSCTLGNPNGEVEL